MKTSGKFAVDVSRGRAVLRGHAVEGSIGQSIFNDISRKKFQYWSHTEVV